MPTVTDYLQSVQGGTALVQVTASTWVRLTNNFTAATFVSQAASSAAGQFTVLNVPAGSYTLATGPSNTGPWTNQDANYIVGDSTLQFNVKDYGAKGDGSTDDSTAIQAANDAANAVGGGIVYFPPATYIGAGLNQDSFVYWQGSKTGATVLKLKNGANTFLVQSRNFATLTGGNTTGGVTLCGISDMTLDGNKANNGSSTVPVFRSYGYGRKFERLHVRNGNNEGWYSEWSTSLPSPGNDSMEDHIVGCKAHDNGSHGVHWNGPHDSQFVDCLSFLNGARGFFVDTNGSGCLFTNCHSYGNSQTYAWYLNATGVLAKNCVAEGASTFQVAIDASDCAFDGFIYAAGAATPKGVQLGVTGSRSGIMLNAKINGCTSGAIDFTNDGGNFVQATIFQVGGTLFISSINANSVVNVRADGLAGSILQARAGMPLVAGAGVRPGTDGGAQQAGNLFMGSGVPSNTNGNNGDFYFRTDTPGTANQRLYIKSAGSWTALTL